MDPPTDGLTTSKSASLGRRKSTLVVFLTIVVVIVTAIVVPVTLTQRTDDGNEKASAYSSTLSEGADGNSSSPLPNPTFPPTVTPPSRSDSPIVSTARPTTAKPTLNPNPTTAPASAPAIWTPPEPELGDAAGTPYLHCPANPAAATANGITVQHIVLLHGASFTKEIWVTTGILQQLCAEPTVSATAFDMSFGTYTELQTILDELVSSMSSSVEMPVVLVTPSAGGSAVVDWMINGDVNALRAHVSLWIPVAVGSLNSASDAQVESIAPLPVLAIYGDGDISGGRSSQRLERLVGATVVELKGGHPVYKDSPDEFVETIFSNLGVD